MKIASKSVLAGLKLSNTKSTRAIKRESVVAQGGPAARHVLVDYADEDAAVGARVVSELETLGWRVFDPSRGNKKLDVNSTISRGVQISDVCVCIVSASFAESKRELKLANFVNQKKLPIIYFLVGGASATLPGGALGIILADAEQADSSERIGQKISALLDVDTIAALKRKDGESEPDADDLSGALPDSIFSGKEVAAAYWQFGSWHDVSFSFFSLSMEGDVIGQGDDVVGAFTVNGVYSMPRQVSKGILGGTKSVPGTISFTKSYIGQHIVLYNGVLSQTGTALLMEGMWTIENYDSQAFRMTLLASASLTNERAQDVNGVDLTEVIYDCAPADLGLVDRLALDLDRNYSIRPANTGSEPIAIKLQQLQTADALVVVLSREFEASSDARKLLTFADKIGKPIIPIHTSPSYTQGKEVAVICAGLLYTVLDAKSYASRMADVANQIIKAGRAAPEKVTVRDILVDSRSVRGWYEAQGAYYPMQFDSLSVSSTAVAGQGRDFVGDFILSGSVELGDSSVKFEKQYLGQHTLQYQGTFERHASGLRIKGIWFEGNAPSNTGKFEVEALESTALQKLPISRSHAFISYCWAEQEFVKQVVDELRRSNVPLFFDIAGDMANNVNEAMADGVDHAFVFLCFASKSYAKSKNCKKEFSYARQRNKTMVALLLDEDLPAEKTAEWLASAINAVDHLPAKQQASADLAGAVVQRISALNPASQQASPSSEMRVLKFGSKILKMPLILPRKAVIESDSSFRTAGVDKRGSFMAMGRFTATPGSSTGLNLKLSKDYVLDPALGDIYETVSYDLELEDESSMKVRKGSKQTRTTAAENECTEKNEPLTSFPDIVLEDSSASSDPFSVPPDPTKVRLKAEYYQAGWHPMIMEMFSLNKGVVLAQGDDPVGSFTCAGAYNEPDAKGLASLSFVKQYIGAHSVRYEGKVRSALVKKQRIVYVEGTWTIGPDYSDKFRIECSVVNE